MIGGKGGPSKKLPRKRRGRPEICDLATSDRRAGVSAVRVRSLDQARRSTRPGRCGKTAPNTTRGARAGFVQEPPRDRSRNFAFPSRPFPLLATEGPQRGEARGFCSEPRKENGRTGNQSREKTKRAARSRVNRRSFSPVNLKRSAFARKSVWGPRSQREAAHARGHGLTTLGDVVCFFSHLAFRRRRRSVFTSTSCRDPWPPRIPG